VRHDLSQLRYGDRREGHFVAVEALQAVLRWQAVLPVAVILDEAENPAQRSVGPIVGDDGGVLVEQRFGSQLRLAAHLPEGADV
jgi:hypothetical protein